MALVVAGFLCCAHTFADELSQRITSKSSIWQEAWDHSPVADVSACSGSNHSGLIEVLTEAQERVIQDIEVNTAPSRDPRYEQVQVVGRGQFTPDISIHLEALAPSATELAARGLTDLQYYTVAGTVVGTSQKTRYLVGFETHATFPDGSTTVILSPTSMEVTSNEAIVQATLNAAIALSSVGAWQAPPGNPPPGTPPPQTGNVWCYCPQCYLDCLAQSDCDGDYNTCVSGCDAIHQACMQGADTVYQCCIGSCNCQGNPGIWCTSLCYACFLNQGIEQGACWVARIGCLSGCELGKTACYSGCYLGSWQQFPNPPGCVGPDWQ
jgi:hypothetical protein